MNGGVDKEGRKMTTIALKATLFSKRIVFSILAGGCFPAGARGIPAMQRAPQRLLDGDPRSATAFPNGHVHSTPLKVRICSTSTR